MTQPYSPTLHRLPDDTSGRFQILREFLLRLHGIDTGTVGRAVDRIGRAEAEAGRTLPLAVREWIVLLDDLERLGRWEEVLRDCWGLMKVPERPAFSLLRAGEDDAHWGPLLKDLDKEDPPTLEYFLDDETGRFKRLRQAAPRVSTWAIEFIVSYLHLSRTLQVQRIASKPTLERFIRRAPDGLVASRIGNTELIEFDGGIIHAHPDGPDSYELRCFAPFTHTTHEAYHSAAHELGQRVDAMIGVIRI